MLHDPRNELKIERNPVHSFGSLWPVTSEVAGSSPVVPAIYFQPQRSLKHSPAHFTRGRARAIPPGGFAGLIGSAMLDRMHDTRHHAAGFYSRRISENSYRTQSAGLSAVGTSSSFPPACPCFSPRISPRPRDETHFSPTQPRVTPSPNPLPFLLYLSRPLNRIHYVKHVRKGRCLVNSTKDPKPKNAVSRRGFLGGMGIGTGAVGAGLLEREAQAAPAAANVVGPGPVPITLNINGKPVNLTVEPRVTLLDALRNHLDYTGAKKVCDRGTCGACTVILAGKSVYACSVLAIDAQGRNIETIEGLPVNNPISNASMARTLHA